MSSRPLIVGIQAAAVAALVALVYLTLLKPEGQDPLEGIEAPGGEPPLTRVERDQGDREGGPQRDREPAENGAASGGGEGGGGGGGPDAGVTAAIAGGTVPGAPGTGAATRAPSDDQYDDTVKSLIESVARGGVSDGARGTPHEVAQGGFVGP